MPLTAGQCACCSRNSCCPHGPRRWQLWLSGSLLRLVYPWPSFDSHDRSIQAFRHSSDALARISRQIRARWGDDRSRRPHRGPLRASHWRPISRLSRDLPSKRHLDRKACPGTQGESGSAGSAPRQGSRRARCRRSGAWKFRIGGFRPRDLADDRAVSRSDSRPRVGFVVCRRGARMAAEAMAIEG